MINDESKSEKLDPVVAEHRERYHSANPITRGFHTARMEKILALVKELGNGIERPRILDVGCGDGTFLSRLAGRLYGLDISAESVSEARKRLDGRGADIRVGDARKMPLWDAQFDVVICSEVLEHIGKPELAVAELMRVAKSGGKIIISVPNEFWLTFGRAAMLKFPAKLKEHVNSFTVADVARMVGKKPAKTCFIPPLIEQVCLFKIMVFEK